MNKKYVVTLFLIMISRSMILQGSDHYSDRDVLSLIYDTRQIETDKAPKSPDEAFYEPDILSIAFETYSLMPYRKNSCNREEDQTMRTLIENTESLSLHNSGNVANANILD
jgi:hypothetical protein